MSKTKAKNDSKNASPADTRRAIAIADTLFGVEEADQQPVRLAAFDAAGNEVGSWSRQAAIESISAILRSY